MQTLRKKTSPLKYRNEPGRFFGDGVSFKAKLIGILEVGEARGDRMCQEALQDLKIAIRAAGEHKQRITIHVTIDGLRLRDEKTGDSLYHHPVHKISFIAQDMTDSRAFGYIFGSPDSGHRFFGIKTDKAASAVVLAMRDLFQVVFELKKKEIELARQHIQSKITQHEHQQVVLSVRNNALDNNSAKSSTNEASGGTKSSTSKSSEKSPESVADLVDLEQELSSIQRGITQMERITPNEVPSKSVLENDPFGDSFTNFPPTYNLLPPPESAKRHAKPAKITENILSDEVTSDSPSSQLNSTSNKMPDDWLNSPPATAVFDDTPSGFAGSSGGNNDDSDEVINSNNNNNTNNSNNVTSSSYIDVFTDLDPLGTGKIKPYVDKKYFFQELKNPPKKVLKDLSTQDVFNVNFNNSRTDESQQNNFNDFNSSIMSGSNTKSNIQNNIIEGSTQRENDFPKKKDILDKDFPTDPFTTGNKAPLADPFMEDEDFSKLSLDPFDVSFSQQSSPRFYSASSSDTKDNMDKINMKDDGDTPPSSANHFNGPLQVNLPPESWAGYISAKRLERQTSESNSQSSSYSSTSRTRFKQNTVDVITSIGSKKMIKPNLFGQKFSKRDSNSINMRRLQESDSLSENETAPEPPPRPDSSSTVEPPPLPPKKQCFADIVIRPTSRESVRYDYVGIKQKNQQNENAPPLPLPSRKIGKSDSNYPPGRPQKKIVEEDDYLTPITSMRNRDIPTLLPPPQKKDPLKQRGQRKSETDPMVVDAPTTVPPPVRRITSRSSESAPTFLPDITLSQLLTLGIDDLASKLKVPVSKLNTMTLVELTTYLSEFIENSKRISFELEDFQTPGSSTVNDSPTFKVSFDDDDTPTSGEATFTARFDDNFGEDIHHNPPFVANFDNFETKIETMSNTATTNNVDKYAIFREIIEQELSQSFDQQFETPIESEASQIEINHEMSSLDFQKEVDIEISRLSPNIQQNQPTVSSPNIPMTKIDTKITEVISQAKDRYAALRDIILVEDLFDNNKGNSFEDELKSSVKQDLFDDMMSDIPNENTQTSPEINISNSEDDRIEDSCTNLSIAPGDSTNNLSTVKREDSEIDEYMKKAISNLSIDSRDLLSPVVTQSQNASTSPIRLNPHANRSPIPKEKTGNSNLTTKAPTLNDMSTSPIPMPKSPIPMNKSPMSKSPIQRSPMSKSPIITDNMIGMNTMSDNFIKKTSPTPQAHGVANIMESYKRSNSESLSDVVCGSSPDDDNNIDMKQPLKQSLQQVPTPNNNNNESWAVFDQMPVNTSEKKESNKNIKRISKNGPDSPYSSDGREDYNRRWAKGQTSSSSRDVSPYDEDGPSDYRRRPHPNDARFHLSRSNRRINSCDEDYEYEDEILDRRGRHVKTRSKDYYDPDSSNYYPEHHNWPEESEQRMEGGRRSFERGYERSTYGPPYEKREPKSLPHYDRRDYKSYDKRKFYRDCGRPGDYDYDPYMDPYEGRGKLRKDYDEVYDGVFERGTRERRGSRDYFNDRDRKSFDSNESYESAGRGHRSFGSGEIYGSFEGRGDYRDRDRYNMSLDKNRIRRQQFRPKPEEEQDSDSDINAKRLNTGSLQRSSQNLLRSIPSVPPPQMDEDIWGPPSSSKSWKRPSSATDQERKMPPDSRRIYQNPLSGSDGEKDRRFRKKTRTRGKDTSLDGRSNFATMSRFPSHQRSDDYYDYDDNIRDESLNNNARINDSIDIRSPSYYAGRRTQPTSHYSKTTTPRSETRSMAETIKLQDGGKLTRFDDEDADSQDKMNISDARRFKKNSNVTRSFSGADKERFGGKFGSGNFDMDTPPKSAKHVRVMDFEFDEYQNNPQSAMPNNKFNFDDNGAGFESDFNSPTPPAKTQTLTPGNNTKSFRFSNDFSDKESPRNNVSKLRDFSSGGGGGSSSSGNNGGGNGTTSKLRFDENVIVAKFDSSESPHMFEDDFAKTDLSIEMEDQWTPDLAATNKKISNIKMNPNNNNINSNININNNNINRQHDNIKKSESVNIFARQNVDPFDDDDFFAAKNDNRNSNGGTASGGNDNDGIKDPFNNWNKNFANFDDNI